MYVLKKWNQEMHFYMSFWYLINKKGNIFPKEVSCFYNSSCNNDISLAVDLFKRETYS